VYTFSKKCEGLSLSKVDNYVIKAKLFPYSLLGEARNWVTNWNFGRRISVGLIVSLLLLKNLDIHKFLVALRG
jgi:hypothetical protein